MSMSMSGLKRLCITTNTPSSSDLLTILISKELQKCYWGTSTLILKLEIPKSYQVFSTSKKSLNPVIRT